MKRLYVTDLDGTLLDRSGRVTKASADILNSLIKEGIFLTYATARSNKSSEIVTKGLNINLPVVTYNGTFVYDCAAKRCLHKVSFTEKQVKALVDLSKSFCFTPLVYTFVNGQERVQWNKNGTLSEGFNYYLGRRRNDSRMTPVNSVEESFCGEVFYVTFIEGQQELQPLYDSIADSEDYNVVFQQELYRTEYWCEIMPRLANKAKAVEKLKKYLNCDELVVFGDSLNDLPMFKIADMSYAVENANPKLKEIATEIIGSNTQDSVAKKILELESRRQRRI